MPDISNPNLCGADAGVNKLLNQFDTIKSEVTGGLDKLASELASELDSGLTQLKNDLRALVPELPALPATNLQAEIKSLQSLIPGSPSFIALSLKLENEFGPALKSAGQDLTNIISAAVPAIGGALGGAEAALGAAIGAATDVAGALGGLSVGSPDICKLAPNMELVAGAAAPLEKAAAVLQAKAAGVAEDASKIVENPNVKAAIAKVDAKVKAFTVTDKEPTKDGGAFKLIKSTAKVVSGASNYTGEDGEEETTTVSVVTPDQVKTTNVATGGGFSNQLQSLNLPIKVGSMSPHPTKKSGLKNFSPDVANNKPLLTFELPVVPYNIFGVLAFRTITLPDGTIFYDSSKITKFKGSDWSKTLKRDDFKDVWAYTKMDGKPTLLISNFNDWDGYPAVKPPGKTPKGKSKWRESLVGTSLVVFIWTYANYDPSIAIDTT